MRIDDRPTIAAPDDDPYLWLEEIEGERALDFVQQQTRLTLGKVRRCAICGGP
jgi:prolyl oligopeptidase